jgi:hypothetical protein
MKISETDGSRYLQARTQTPCNLGGCLERVKLFQTLHDQSKTGHEESTTSFPHVEGRSIFCLHFPSESLNKERGPSIVLKKNCDFYHDLFELQHLWEKAHRSVPEELVRVSIEY